MTSWTAGYVLDIPYTSGFYRELSPEYLSFVVAGLAGVRPPRLGPGAAYCELACGQGFGTALLAAANPDVSFYGFDFAPGQIANAVRLAGDAGLDNVLFDDKSFEECVALPDDVLPRFDVVTLHGIYSWISPENRALIVKFLERKLKPGGIVYISYNCMPGWSTMAPVQRLLREHANRNPNRSDLQVEEALKFVTDLSKGGARFFASNPSLGPRLEQTAQLNKNYLAHEYLNGHWYPLYHLDVARELDSARLTYACTATITEGIDAIAVPPEMHALLGALRDPNWAETIRDFASNKQFRRDIFARGPTRLSNIDQMNIFGDMALCLMQPAGPVAAKFAGPLGQVDGQQDLYAPFTEALQSGPKTMNELMQLPAFAGKPLATLVQVALLYLHNSTIHPLPRYPVGEKAEAAKRFNRAVARRLLHGENLGFVAAPAAGNGLSATFVELMMILVLADPNEPSREDVLDFFWSVLAKTGWRLVKDGKTIEEKAATFTELGVQIDTFMAEKVPLWRLLGVI